MTSFARLDAVLDALTRSPGPGGAVAVLKDGVILARQTWGWADMERRIPFSPETLFRICSISKQFTCAVMLDQFPEPDLLNADLAGHLPLLGDGRPTVRQMAHNQSGLRDYWATAMLCGAPAEGVFGPEDARALISRTTSLHFPPGTHYSYCNHNFRLLGDLVADRTGRSLGSLMRRQIFDRAGMPTALLCPETSALPDGTVGYEGSLAEGWRAAVNRVHWTGDAGIAASLDDMIAWEQAIDAVRDDPDCLYARLSAPTSFADGTPASYGFGLSRMSIHGRLAVGHGGGLRGWRSVRFYAPAERISVVVLLNHMGDPRPAAVDLFGSLLDLPPADPKQAPDLAWAGGYFDPATGLVARLEVTPDQRLGLWFGQTQEVLDIAANGDAVSGGLHLRRTGTGISMRRDSENFRADLVACGGVAPRDIEGVFRSAEYDAKFTCVSAGGALYGAFSGFLGNGMMQVLLPVGPDVWRLPMPRALDFAAPGDWSLRFRRDADGRVQAVQIGCWLARGVEFLR